MQYPTLEAVEAADQYQLCEWHRFLPGPGMSAIDKPEEFHAQLEADAKSSIVLRNVLKLVEGSLQKSASYSDGRSKYLMIKVKKWIEPGELSGDELNEEEIYDSAARLMEKSYTHDVFGPAEFIGEDGKKYRVLLEAKIVESDEDDSTV